MVYVPVQCPHCQSTAVIKAGKQANGSQGYQGQNGQCARRPMVNAKSGHGGVNGLDLSIFTFLREEPKKRK